MTAATRTAPRGRSLGLLLCLAMLPFAAKLGVIALGSKGYLWQSLYKLLQLAGPVWWRRRLDGERGWACLWPTQEPLPGVGTWALAVGVAAALGGTAILAILWLAGPLGIDPQLLRSGLDEKFTMTPLRAAGVVLYLLTFNAALEELHFRAWLDHELSRQLGDFAGIGLSAAAFAAMHLLIFAGLAGAPPVALPLVFVALAIAGVSWSLLIRRPGGIHAAWLSHGLTDAGLLTWGLFWLGYF